MTSCLSLLNCGVRATISFCGLGIQHSVPVECCIDSKEVPQNVELSHGKSGNGCDKDTGRERELAKVGDLVRYRRPGCCANVSGDITAQMPV